VTGESGSESVPESVPETESESETDSSTSTSSGDGAPEAGAGEGAAAGAGGFRRWFLHLLALDCLAIDVKMTVDHANAVTGHADHTLDVIDRGVARQPEDGNVAALGLVGQDTVGK